MKAYENGRCCEMQIDNGGFIHICYLENKDHRKALDDNYKETDELYHKCSCGQSFHGDTK